MGDQLSRLPPSFRAAAISYPTSWPASSASSRSSWGPCCGFSSLPSPGSSTAQLSASFSCSSWAVAPAAFTTLKTNGMRPKEVKAETQGVPEGLNSLKLFKHRVEVQNVAECFTHCIIKLQGS